MDQLSHFAHILPLVTLLIPSNITYIKQQVIQKLLWSLLITVHVTDETADTYFCYCTTDVYIAEAFFNPWIIFPLIFFSFLQSLHLSTTEILMNRSSLLPEVPSWLDPCKQQPLISRRQFPPPHRVECWKHLKLHHSQISGSESSALWFWQLLKLKITESSCFFQRRAPRQSLWSDPETAFQAPSLMTAAVICLSQDFQDLVLGEQPLATSQWALWAHGGGSCIVFNYILRERTFYRYGKFCSCALQVLPSLLTWVFLQRWKPEELQIQNTRLHIWEQPGFLHKCIL